MKLPTPVQAVAQKLVYTRNLFYDLNSLVNDTSQTYYPDHRRKSKWSILRDQLVWILRNKELNRYYYVLGLDRRDENKSRELIGYRKFRLLRDRYNHKPKGLNFNYACMMRDKFLFGQFLTSLNVPTPKNVALINCKGITWLHNMEQSSLEAIRHMNIDGFCKKLMGLKGEGAFPLRTENGKIYTENKEIRSSELKSKLDETYVWQERMKQHPEMARLHPQSLNTVRILTFNNNGKVEVFFCAMRMGTNGRSVDNYSAGGIAIGVNSETGQLFEYGQGKPGTIGRAYAHPNTGVRFSSFTIPHFQECLDIVCKVHRYLYGLHSIGWDVAITENGPVIIEGNDVWDGSFAMNTQENFKSRFLAMYQAAK